eukprot:TRINITY_DN7803_c0_g3_i1.p1 TRINITY_DN7803_c0_g3~~TRINITY_DN7803_c0_g3_i1.p1  ORF type:complete len:103 (+),score=4.27 TRINITY_DN7803_c0_g3_i1:131-439(+)
MSPSVSLSTLAVAAARRNGQTGVSRTHTLGEECDMTRHSCSTDPGQVTTQRMIDSLQQCACQAQQLFFPGGHVRSSLLHHHVEACFIQTQLVLEPNGFQGVP